MNFPVNFPNFLTNTFFTENLWTTASRFCSKYLFYRVLRLSVKKSSSSKVSGLEPATLNENETLSQAYFNLFSTNVELM